ncbi:uncharacterized protein LOC105353978 isoform X1 [Oryzias latipes]
MTCLDRRSWKRFGSAFGTSGLNPSLMTSDLPTSTPETSRTNFFPAVVTDTPSHCLPEELQVWCMKVWPPIGPELEDTALRAPLGPPHLVKHCNLHLGCTTITQCFGHD